MIKKSALFLVNLGTPSAPDPVSVGKYLTEFLMDEDVIDVPYLLRFILVRGIIVPRRKYASAHAYQKVWTETGSPLKFHSENLLDAVGRVNSSHTTKRFDVISYAMRYGAPSMMSRIAEMQAQGVESITVLPLYPQFATATSTSTRKEFERCLKVLKYKPIVKFIEEFYKEDFFIEPLASIIKKSMSEEKIDHVLFSYHGLPERHILKANSEAKNHCFKTARCCDVEKSYCYKSQCYATTRALVAKLNLAPNQYSVSFQSRLAGAKWIDPYTDEVIPELVKKGVKSLAVVCPAFVSDCLETLEEIGIRAREDFLNAGGERFTLIPCVNSDVDFAKGLLDAMV